mgnify:CR=1 FL=1|jgi:hypothetical protein
MSLQTENKNTIQWTEYENDNLVHRHKTATMYKKRYQRASDFHNSLYRLFGLISVVSSSIVTTLSWNNSSNDDGSDLYEENINNNLLISSMSTIAAISAAIQNFYKFQEISNKCTITAKLYGKLQNSIECVGNIHPDYRFQKPYTFNKKIQDKFDQIYDSRIDISSWMVTNIYSKKGDDHSYLEEKHKKNYKNINDEEKLEYSKNTNIIKMSVQSDDSDSDN